MVFHVEITDYGDIRQKDTPPPTSSFLLVLMLFLPMTFVSSEELADNSANHSGFFSDKRFSTGRVPFLQQHWSVGLSNVNLQHQDYCEAFCFLRVGISFHVLVSLLKCFHSKVNQFCILTVSGFL